MSHISPVMSDLQLSQNIIANSYSQAKSVGQESELSGRDITPIALPEQVLAHLDDQLKQFLQDHQYELRFTLDPETKSITVSVINTATQEVVRRIPLDHVESSTSTLMDLNPFLNIQV